MKDEILRVIGAFTLAVVLLSVGWNVASATISMNSTGGVDILKVLTISPSSGSTVNMTGNLEIEKVSARINLNASAGGVSGIGFTNSSGTRGWLLYDANGRYNFYKSDGTSSVFTIVQETGDITQMGRINNGNSGATAHAVSDLEIEDDDHAFLTFMSPNGSHGGIFFADPEESVEGKIYYRHLERDMKFNVAGDTTRLTITADNITMGTDVDLDMNSNELNGIGQMQLNPTELTIAGGVVNVTLGHHSIDTESDGATDDLDTINGGSNGDILIIMAQSSARTVVAKDGTGNLALAGDFSMDNREDSLMLRYDLGVGKWCEISRSDNGS